MQFPAYHRKILGMLFFSLILRMSTLVFISHVFAHWSILQWIYTFIKIFFEIIDQIERNIEITEKKNIFFKDNLIF